VAAVGAPGLTGGVKLSHYRRAQSGDDVGLECPEDRDGTGEVRRHVAERGRGRPVPVTDKPAVVEVALENGQRRLRELAREVGWQAPVGPRRAVELVGVQAEPAVSQRGVNPASGVRRGARGAGQPPQTGQDVRGHRVGDVVRAGLDVQGDRAGVAVLQQVVDEHQVGEQLPARVVSHDDGPGVRPQSGPQVSTVIGDEPERCRVSRPRRHADPETQIGAVAPQRRQQLGRPLLASRELLEVIERGQVRLQRGIAEFGGLEVLERVDPPPRAGSEESDRIQEPPVEVRLRPEERRVQPGHPEIARTP